MNIEFTGRNMTVTARQKTLATDELERIGKMIGRVVGAHVILTEDNYRMKAEVTVNSAHDTLVAHSEDTDMQKALHDALRKVEQQALKHKERKLTVDRHAKPDSAVPLIEVASPPSV